MKISAILIVMLVAFTMGCSSTATLSRYEFQRRHMAHTGEAYNTVYYMGTKDGYHYLHHNLFFTFGPFIYRIKEADLPLSPKRAYSERLNDWVPLRIRHKMTVEIEPGEQTPAGDRLKAGPEE